jgi:triosephosphate isomerase
MIRPLVVGNWKMNKTVKEAIAFADLLKDRIYETGERRVAIAPPFTALYSVGNILAGSAISLAAQNVSDREDGAVTGEISARMLVDAGCRFVIVGHSERRSFFGEGDDLVNRKIRIALQYQIAPIFCVGETLSERESGATFAVLEQQVTGGLKDIAASDAVAIIIAYEPVWAIGTGKTAQPEQAAEIHRFIRETVSQGYGRDIAYDLPILYGGSVNPANIDALMARPEINGVLVGGASLDGESFMRIVGV